MNYCTRILLLLLFGTSVALADTAAPEKAQKGVRLVAAPLKNKDITPQMQIFSNLCERIVKLTIPEMKSNSDYEDIQEAIKVCYKDSYRKTNPSEANALFGFALLRFVLIMMHEMNTIVAAVATPDILKIEDQDNPDAGMWRHYEQSINFVNMILNKNILPLLHNFNPALLVDAQQNKEAVVLVSLLKKESDDLFRSIKQKLTFVKNSIGKDSFLYKQISAPANILYHKLHPKSEQL